MPSLLQWKTMNIAQPECVYCNLRYPECNVHAPCCHLGPAPLCNTFSTLSQSGFRKNFTEKKVLVLISLQLLSEVFLILRRNERDEKMCIGRHVKCPLFLSDFNENLIFSTDFRKPLNYQISLKPFQWEPSCSMRTDGRTNRQTDITVVFRNFVKAPKN